MNTTNGNEDFLSKTDMFEISGEMSSSDQLSQLNVNDDDDDDYNAEAVNVGGGGGGALDFDFSSLELDDDRATLKLKATHSRKLNIELRQLKHDLQLAKIALAQRDYQLNSMRVEYANKCEQLHEANRELTHQNHMLNVRLSNIMAIHQEEDQKKQEHIQHELQRILVRQKELEENNERFVKHENDMKRELRNIDPLAWSTEEYEFMARRDEDLLTLNEFATLKLHQIIRPLKVKLDEAIRHAQSVDEELRRERNELHTLKQVLDDERRTFNVNAVDSQKLYYELADAKSLLQQANFKRDNYDRTKHERDDLERKLTESETRLAKTGATLNVCQSERDELSKDLGQLKQEISLLRQDKDYLHRQHVEAQSRLRLVEDKLDQAQQQHDETKRAKDELYASLLSARDSYKREYEEKMSKELGELKASTNREIDKLRADTKEFYERELRSLRDTCEAGVRERERLEAGEREMNVRLQEASGELRMAQMAHEAKVGELRAELKFKTFELERTQLIGDENGGQLKRTLIENEKMHKKIEIIQNEYYSLQLQHEKRVLEVESELAETRQRLDAYEKVEAEMDKVIKQVAETSVESGGEISESQVDRVLLSYGYGANIVMNAKKRIQQNVHLTRRVLQLEQLNTQLRIELAKERNTYTDLHEQLDIAKSVIDNTKQPHEYLVRSIQSKETQLRRQQTIIESLQKKLDELSVEKESLLRDKNEMSLDMEKLIRFNEELLAIKNELKNAGMLSHSSSSNSRMKKSQSSGGSRSKQQQQHQQTANGMDVESLRVQPRPLAFTKSSGSTRGSATALNRSASPKQRYQLRHSPARDTSFANAFIQ